MQACKCEPNTEPNGEFVVFSTSGSRIQAAQKKAKAIVTKLLDDHQPVVSDDYVHLFERGFCVAEASGSDSHALLGVSSVVDKIPYDFSISYDLSVLTEQDSGDGPKDEIMWVRVDITAPLKRSIKIPLLGVGVVRAAGQIVSVQGWELFPALLDDTEELLTVVACLLACAGLTCGWQCAAACTPATIPLCIACITACAGANAAAIAVCIAACKELLGRLR